MSGIGKVKKTLTSNSVINRGTLAAALFALLVTSLHAEQRVESFYQKIVAETLGGEKADNWKESIGQALNYAFQSNKKTGIVLIVDKPTDSIRLMSVVKHYELPITIWTLTKETTKLTKIRI